MFLCHSRVSFSISASIILVVDQTMPQFQVCKSNFGAHDQQVYSAASSAFQELFPSSPATMKSFEINLPSLYSVPQQKLYVQNKAVEFSFIRAKSNFVRKPMKFAHFFPLTCVSQMDPLDLKWFREKKKKRSVIYGISWIHHF